MAVDLHQLFGQVKQRDPHQTVFHQAVEEVFTSLTPFLAANSHYAEHGLLERLVEPERVILFRVPWMDDAGKVQVNRGFRVQMNSAIGLQRRLAFSPQREFGRVEIFGVRASV